MKRLAQRDYLWLCSSEREDHGCDSRDRKPFPLEKVGFAAVVVIAGVAVVLESLEFPLLSWHRIVAYDGIPSLSSLAPKPRDLSVAGSLVVDDEASPKL